MKIKFMALEKCKHIRVWDARDRNPLLKKIIAHEKYFFGSKETLILPLTCGKV